MTYRFFLVCLLAAVLLLAPFAPAAVGAVLLTASLNGVVVDPSGASVPGAKVSSVISRLGF